MHSYLILSNALALSASHLKSQRCYVVQMHVHTDRQNLYTSDVLFIEACHSNYGMCTDVCTCMNILDIVLKLFISVLCKSNILYVIFVLILNYNNVKLY